MSQSKRLKKAREVRARIRRHVEESHVFSKTIEVFSNICEVNEAELYQKSRNRRVVECRAMIWSYMRTRTNVTFQDLGAKFGLNHCTALHQWNRHQYYISYVLDKPFRMHEHYAQSYDAGRDLLDDYFLVDSVDLKGYKYRLIMMVDDYPSWNKQKVIEAEQI